jgi:DNA-binding MarR family transcriptional regulator
MVENLEQLVRGEIGASEARQAIWRELDAEEGYRTTYAALCRWTWRAMIERRLDDEVKSWHRLLLDVAGRIAVQADSGSSASDRAHLDRSAAAERVRALADLVRLLVDAAEASTLKDFTARAHVSAILRLLASRAGIPIEREEIKTELRLRDANLSRVLTLLAANGLVERVARGKNAAFRVTPHGAALAKTSAEEVGATSVKPPHSLFVTDQILSHATESFFRASISYKHFENSPADEAVDRVYQPAGPLKILRSPEREEGSKL